MPNTSNMNLTLPTVSVTAGPTFATQINTAITSIDAHDHTTGKGVQVPSAGINIDANLSFGGYTATGLKATAFTAQAAAITDTYRLWAKADGNLYYTNGSGTPVQITSSGTLNTSGLVTAVYSPLSLAGNVTIGPSDSSTLYLVNTAAPRSITLPAANAVQTGRYYIFTDTTGGAASNNITISRAGSDTIEGGTSWVIDRNYGSARFISDGANKWTVITEHDASTTAKGSIKLAGDLGGTAAAPTVVGLTGTAGVVAFGASVASPSITQTVASGTGSNMSIQAQSAGGAANDGGTLTLQSGTGSGSGLAGRVQLAIGGTVMVTTGQFSSTRRYISLGGQVTSTNIPTGDYVVWISNASTSPSSNPVGGGILYCWNGALRYRGTSGNDIQVAAA